MRLLAACAPEELRIDQPQQRAFQGIDRDHRMQRDAAALRLRADCRRVLHSMHMATTDPAARAPRRRSYNLRHAHRRLAPEARARSEEPTSELQSVMPFLYAVLRQIK